MLVLMSFMFDLNFLLKKMTKGIQNQHKEMLIKKNFSYIPSFFNFSFWKKRSSIWSQKALAQPLFIVNLWRIRTLKPNKWAWLNLGVYFGIVFSPLLLFADGSSVEGSFLLRNTGFQIQSPVIKDFSTYSQFYLKGEFQPSNKIKTEVHLLSSQNYGNENSSKGDQLQLYPSAQWLLSESIELLIGRNFYKRHSIGFSRNSFESSWYSLDGMILSYSATVVDFDFWSAYLPERWVAGEKEREFDYGFGFFLNIDLDSFYIDSFHFEVSYLADSFLDQNADKMSRYGFNMKGTVSDLNVDYNFFAIGHSSGLEFKLEENMYHGEIQYKKEDFFNSTLSIGYHTDSSHYNPWFYNRHEHGGLSDYLQWRNLSYYFIQASFAPLSKLAVQIMFLDFNANQQGEIDLGYFGSAIHGDKSLSVSKGSLGQELNLKILSQMNEQLEIQFLTACFLAQAEALTKNASGFHNNIQLSAFYKF